MLSPMQQLTRMIDVETSIDPGLELMPELLVRLENAAKQPSKEEAKEVVSSCLYHEHRQNCLPIKQEIIELLRSSKSSADVLPFALKALDQARYLQRWGEDMLARLIMELAAISGKAELLPEHLLLSLQLAMKATRHSRVFEERQLGNLRKAAADALLERNPKAAAVATAVAQDTGWLLGEQLSRELSTKLEKAATTLSPSTATPPSQPARFSWATASCGSGAISVPAVSG